MQRHRGDVRFVGVAGRDELAAMQEFVDRHGLHGMIHVADFDGAVWQRFGIAAQPAWVFVDGDTDDARTLHGALGPTQLDAELRRLAG